MENYNKQQTSPVQGQEVFNKPKKPWSRYILIIILLIIATFTLGTYFKINFTGKENIQNNTEKLVPVDDVSTKLSKQVTNNCFGSQTDEIYQMKGDIDIVDWRVFNARYFSIKHPNGVNIRPIEDTDNEYLIENSNFNGNNKIKVIPLLSAELYPTYGAQNYSFSITQRFVGTVFYEIFSNKWWRLDDPSNNLSNAMECHLDVIGRTLNSQYPIFIGGSYYFVLIKDIPNEPYKTHYPIIIVIDSYYGDTGEGLEFPDEESKNEYFKVENDAISTLEMMIKTIDIRPGSVG